MALNLLGYGNIINTAALFPEPLLQKPFISHSKKKSCIQIP